MSYQEPIAEVIASDKLGPVVRTVLKISSPQPPPAAPASLISLEDARAGKLDLHRVIRRDGDLLTFETYDARAEPMQVGGRFYFRPWWPPWALELVQDTTKQWHRRQFEPTDSVRYAGDSTIALDLTRLPGDLAESPGEGVVIPGGWDHEHCRLCWEKISVYEGDQHTGYTDGHDWICEACHHTYIASGFGRKLGDVG